MRKFFRRLILSLLAFVLLTAAGGAYIVRQGLQPTASGEPVIVRFEGNVTRRVAFSRLEKEGVLRNAAMTEVWARFTNQPTTFAKGSYSVRPGMSPEDIIKSLAQPLQNRVRLREGWWISRQAPALQEANVCDAEEYIAATKQPEKFRKEFSWLPAGIQSLEGFLFPDTYFLAPNTAADDVIREQLGAFEQKVLPKVRNREKLYDYVIKGSLIELEAKHDHERPKVSGVIHNRLRKGQALEIDATVLYALQRWFVLPPGVVRTVKSPFNTYLNQGLPPGPIGSPSLASIEAAQNPESHPYYFYVALPDGNHLFSTTYAQHIANIRRARAAAR